MSGRILKSKLKTEIKINLKTLYGDRNVYTYFVKIDDKISSLVRYLVEDEMKFGNVNESSSENRDNRETNENKENKETNENKESREIKERKKWNKNNQYRLIGVNGVLRELNQYKSFIQENVREGQTLILAPPLDLSFSSLQHGPGILIQNNNTVAHKQNGDEHQYAIANRGFNSGCVYCEFTLDTEPVERNIMIGVTTERTDYYFNCDARGFWGYVPSE